MHDAAFRWVSRLAQTTPATAALDIGGRDVNGSCRILWPQADWTVLDIDPGDGVDVVADAATWLPDRQYDLVLCTEVLEHTPERRMILATARDALRTGGRLILTCAGPGRSPHSGVDGGPLRVGEYYGNVDPDDMKRWLRPGWRSVSVQYAPNPCDLYATAVKLGVV
jgi:SAM-dependent methyltransferase